MSFPNTTWGHVLKTFLFTAFAAFLCFFLHLSITMVLSMAGRTVLGKQVTYTMADGSTVVVQTYDATEEREEYTVAYRIDAQGNETEVPVEEVQELKYTGTPFEQNIRSDIDPTMKVVGDWVAQIFMAILFLAFPYSNMWNLGARDRNAVLFGHQAEKQWRGIQIGLLASVPALAGWGALVIGKLFGLFGGFVKYYRWMNFCVASYFEWMIPAGIVDPVEVPWSGVLGMIPVLVVLPLITGLGYFLGYKEFSVRDRLLYSATGKTVKRRRK